ncbi:MAG: cadherin-like beta sandwich domain-containing protein, partial [Oscillospiraceae bacterium]|nr:cadherin-like beta sandwich domain-containing protein [Oscillospiraceae bacterium]
MKRILSLCLALLLLAPALSLTAAATDVYVSFSDPWVRLDGSVTVTVHASVPVAGVSLRLVYDTEYLRYEGSYGGMGNAVVNAEGGSLSIVDYDSQSEADFTLNLSFTALKQGETRIQVSSCAISDAGGDSMNATWGSSLVTITSGSSDATLSRLSIDPGSISPAFSPDVTEYSATVGNHVTWIAVSAARNDVTASTFVAGHDRLQVGENTVTVTVTAGDGTRKVYTIRVTREAELSPAPTPVPTAQPETTPEPVPTAEAKTVYAKVADGSFMVIGSTAGRGLPAGYMETEFVFDGQLIRGAEKDGRRVVWLLAGGSNDAGLYFFDIETGTASHLDSLMTEGKSYRILPLTEAAEIPEGFTQMDTTLEGIAATVLLPPEGDWLLFYGSA